MSKGLPIAGIVCMVAAILIGGARRLGARMPVLNTLPQQMMLFALGLMILLGSFVNGGTPAPRAADSQASDDVDACVVQAFTCLPRSASPVVFRNEAAANAAAAQNIRDRPPAAEAQAATEKLGASGQAARPCGDVQSDESSPLSKHLAAVRLTHPRPGDGKATDACLKMAKALL